MDIASWKENVDQYPPKNRTHIYSHAGRNWKTARLPTLRRFNRRTSVYFRSSQWHLRGRTCNDIYVPLLEKWFCPLGDGRGKFQILFLRNILLSQEIRHTTKHYDTLLNIINLMIYNVRYSVVAPNVDSEKEFYRNLLLKK